MPGSLSGDGFAMVKSGAALFPAFGVCHAPSTISSFPAEPDEVAPSPASLI
ncbi:hypothetical protein [Nonomuraea guangzhouensis]|uniref:Uncharacterized protein n=1 Tax=Nonomuraea guangzhouensis TaxID=1291555 RepID=A0ABW4GUV6_9ACTN|nr:hypothetical protein [Nonomuraea guangzhouensis]